MNLNLLGNLNVLKYNITKPLNKVQHGKIENVAGYLYSYTYNWKRVNMVQIIAGNFHYRFYGVPSEGQSV
jgi:hypothetical protein